MHYFLLHSLQICEVFLQINVFRRNWRAEETDQHVVCFTVRKTENNTSLFKHDLSRNNSIFRKCPSAFCLILSPSCKNPSKTTRPQFSSGLTMRCLSFQRQMRRENKNADRRWFKVPGERPRSAGLYLWGGCRRGVSMATWGCQDRGWGRGRCQTVGGSQRKEREEKIRPNVNCWISQYVNLKVCVCVCVWLSEMTHNQPDYLLTRHLNSLRV